ncbi:hypothetical protein [Paenarthrobacter ureafaciens]|uniref:hypothetical protein n=1 Tax=Paenarthrobacter ureafaciens TaxID=37931 RepID=UPI002DB72D28|nr:hypothetical protein [Paenarthrobacter ureafaciens]MEC3853980.1 hypothetical protein [Paenarthrobacter ureafaciens]
MRIETIKPIPNRWNDSDQKSLGAGNQNIDQSHEGEELTALPWMGWHYKREAASRVGHTADSAGPPSKP